MNRRGFLQLLGAAGAMAATGLSLEELLAPEKTIFLPAVVPQSVLLRNAELIINPPLFVPQLWSNEILRVFKTNLVLANKVSEPGPFTGRRVAHLRVASRNSIKSQ